MGQFKGGQSYQSVPQGLRISFRVSIRLFYILGGSLFGYFLNYF